MDKRDKKKKGFFPGILYISFNAILVFSIQTGCKAEIAPDDLIKKKCQKSIDCNDFDPCTVDKCTNEGYCSITKVENVDIDNDGDGFKCTEGDCNDYEPQIGPSMDEICDDNIDNDCSGNADVEPGCECCIGKEERQDCDQCGVQVRVCDTSCKWSAWGECTKECTPGIQETRVCGACETGEQQRSCQENCGWGDWSTCQNESTECLPGNSQECDKCGERVCDESTCKWGPCLNQKECEAGVQQQLNNCGLKECTKECTWQTLQESGECAAGSSRKCGYCSEGLEFCTSQCEWSNICTNQGTCIPNSTKPCGNCGKEVCSSITCEYDSCSGEGVCSSGQTETAPCDYDNCSGYKRRTCNSLCQWGNYTPCSSAKLILYQHDTYGGTQKEFCAYDGSWEDACDLATVSSLHDEASSLKFIGSIDSQVRLYIDRPCTGLRCYINGTGSWVNIVNLDYMNPQVSCSYTNASSSYTNWGDEISGIMLRGYSY